MGWFDSQLKKRKKVDDQNFEEALQGISGAVLGKRLTSAFKNTDITMRAIDEILKYYKVNVKEAVLPKNIKTAEEQIDFRIRPFGIMRRRVKLAKGWQKCAIGAMLGTLKENGRLVALIPSKLSGYYYIDFTTGKKIHITNKISKTLDEEAICFYKPLPLKKLRVRDLINFMKDQLTVLDVVLYLGGLVIITLIGLLVPMFTKILFGEILESQDLKLLISMGVFMTCFSITQILIWAFNAFIQSKIEAKVNLNVEAAIMSRALSLPTSFFNKFSSGELATRCGYGNILCRTILTSVVHVCITSLFSFTYIAQVVTFAPSLVLPSLLVTLISIGFSLLVAYRQTKITNQVMELTSKESGMSYSLITGIQKIKLAGAEKRMFSRWAKLYQKKAYVSYNPPLLVRLNTAIALAITVFGNMIIFAIAYTSKVEVSDYYAFNSAFAMVSAALTSLATIATSMSTVKPSLNMVKPILETVPEYFEGKEILNSIQGGIEISNVTFKYGENMPTILDDFSLKIKPGEYIGIVGKTGCGKSTLVRLLLGFEKAQKGTIFFDNKDINNIDAKSLRRRMGVVTQNGKLFMGDIYSNIVIGVPQATVDEAWEAAKIASIDDDIRALPMGMNTVISEGHGGISGGQKQRLMIARALVGKPKILIFDEATSALDNITQAKVSDAIDSLRCTRLVIAHRLSTIKNCDRIVVLDDI